jgi:hypothetical protein
MGNGDKNKLLIQVLVKDEDPTGGGASAPSRVPGVGVMGNPAIFNLGWRPSFEDFDMHSDGLKAGVQAAVKAIVDCLSGVQPSSGPWKMDDFSATFGVTISGGVTTIVTAGAEATIEVTANFKKV